MIVARTLAMPGLLMLLVLAASSPAAAHKGHKPSPATIPASLVASPSAEPGPADGPPPGAPAPTEAAETYAPADDEPTPLTLGTINWRSALLEHPHNKIVHFPLAFGLAAGVFLFLAPRRPAYEPAARLLLIVGTLAALAAYFSGQSQHEAFEDGMLEGIMELHEKSGIATGVTLALGAVLTSLEAARRWRRLYAVLLLLVLSATGFLGGLLSHGMGG